MDSSAGVNGGDAGPIRVLAGEVERLVHGVRSIADADGENGSHAGVPGAGEQRVAVLVVARAVEMGVGVDHYLKALAIT